MKHLQWQSHLSRSSYALRWRHNQQDGVSNHQPHDCLLNRLFRRSSKKTSKLRVTGLCVGNSPWPVNSPDKGPVTRKMFPFDDVIMARYYWFPFVWTRPVFLPLWHICWGYFSGMGATIPESKVHGPNMGPVWGRQNPGGPRVGHKNLVIWDVALD